MPFQRAFLRNERDYVKIWTRVEDQGRRVQRIQNSDFPLVSLFVLWCFRRLFFFWGGGGYCASLFFSLDVRRRKDFEHESHVCELFEVIYGSSLHVTHTHQLTPSVVANHSLTGRLMMTACIGLPTFSRTIKAALIPEPPGVGSGRFPVYLAPWLISSTYETEHCIQVPSDSQASPLRHTIYRLYRLRMLEAQKNNVFFKYVRR